MPKSDEFLIEEMRALPPAVKWIVNTRMPAAWRGLLLSIVVDQDADGWTWFSGGSSGADFVDYRYTWQLCDELIAAGVLEARDREHVRLSPVLLQADPSFAEGVIEGFLRGRNAWPDEPGDDVLHSRSTDEC